MQATMRCKVLGMKFFRGSVEGTQYDNTKIYVEVKLDDTQGRAVGFATQEYVAGDSSVYEAHKSDPFPGEYELDIETVTSGSKMKQVVRGMRRVKFHDDKKDVKAA